MKIGIVGTGLIGGSIARDLRAAGYHVSGSDISDIHCQQALDLGVVDEILNMKDMALQCQVIVVSIPVLSTLNVIHSLLDIIPWTSVVMDTCSTKLTICEGLRKHPKRGRFVACHPLAGTEFSGPRAAITGLFENKKNIICEEQLSDEDALDKAFEILQSIKMQNLFMDPAAHDRHMAYVSHISHVTSFMLGTTVLDIEEDEKQIHNLASTGFASTVRLAKSSPETWASIFNDNSENITRALESYIDHLTRFKDAIEKKDNEKMKEMMVRANEIKRVLNGMKYNAIKLS